MALSFPALLLLLSSVSPAAAEVGANMFSNPNRCQRFFAFPPSGLPAGAPYQQICQTRNGVREYATLYNTALKIPVFSAYQYLAYNRCGRPSRWLIEPQLDDSTKGPSMSSDSNQALWKPPRGNNQALNEDYPRTRYDKGHLAPVFHRQGRTCVDATFTLTNAAPQDYSFNRGQWKVMEAAVAAILNARCLNVGFTAYIVTGVVPGANAIGANVNVPSVFWSAYCCVDNNNVRQFSGAYRGPNRNVVVTPYTVGQLDQVLQVDYGWNNFQVFGGRC